MSLLAFSLALAAAPAEPSPTCLDVRHRDVNVALAGQLERRIYPGPPNYGEGPNDQPETVYVLVLDRPQCILTTYDLSGLDPREVHVYATADRPWPGLRAGIGRRVRIKGRGFSAFNPHHRGPLVVELRDVSVESAEHVRR